jgi:hypothetical protein
MVLERRRNVHQHLKHLHNKGGSPIPMDYDKLNRDPQPCGAFFEACSVGFTMHAFGCLRSPTL